MAQKENFPGEGMIRSQKPSVVAAVGAVIVFLFFLLIGSGWIFSLLLGVAGYFLIIWLLGRCAASEAAARAEELRSTSERMPVAGAAGTDAGAAAADTSQAGATSGAASFASMPSNGHADADPASADAGARAEREAASARDAAAKDAAAREAAARDAAAKPEARAPSSASGSGAGGARPDAAGGSDPAVGVVAVQPAKLAGARDGKADDLKKIKGVGPKLEGVLNGLGYFHYDQIAAWTASEIAWVDANIEGFNGRATRDEWVAQAKLLAAGGETEFSRRVDKGEVY